MLMDPTVYGHWTYDHTYILVLMISGRLVGIRIDFTASVFLGTSMLVPEFDIFTSFQISDGAGVFSLQFA